MTAPSPEDVARALHTQYGHVAARVGAVRPICLCGADLPAVAVSIADGDRDAAALLIHTMHVQDVIVELRGVRMMGDPPPLSEYL